MERYRIKPDAAFDLAKLDPSDTGDFAGGKKEGRRHLARLNARIAELQQMLWAQGSAKVLIVLQAMDTGGKDGTIRNVFRGVNPQGVDVTGFKAPTPEELAHDYLWRIHHHTPASGRIAVFNRSHYEDVLIVRVLGLVPEERWSKRYDHIVAFEKLLADEGTTILKFFLNISRDEQRERLQARLDDPDKHWKFSLGDLAVRTQWHDYMAAYQDAIARTSTSWAPWYVVPANRKWYRNIVVAQTIIDALERLGLGYPEPEDDLTGVVVE